MAIEALGMIQARDRFGEKLRQTWGGKTSVYHQLATWKHVQLIPLSKTSLPLYYLMTL
jgi:hypothetical protein